MTRSILVIDDEESVRKSFVLALEDHDYQVITAESGEAGLNYLNQKKYDLIFLDLKMPKMSGVEVLKKIRSTDKQTPIYIVTAFHQEYFQELQACASSECHFELLTKPIGQQQILAVVEGVLTGAVKVD